MFKTQDAIPVADIKDDVVILKNGDMAVILETSAVNFGLLSANEQYAIIGAFAGLLNSLSFSIQILIRSKRLDITDYLKLLDGAYKQQQNPLLANMMLRYRNFIETIVRENEVLDKQFYVVISISYLEMGITKSNNDAETMKKAATLLMPRRDHIIRQLARIGLKANQLNHEQLTKLFYDLYNFDPKASPQQVQKPLADQSPLPGNAGQPTQQPAANPAPVQTAPPAQPFPQPAVPAQPAPAQYPPTQPVQSNVASVNPNVMRVPSGDQSQPMAGSINQPVRRPAPFVVEELHDEYTTPR